MKPCWRQDGKQIFYLTLTGRLMAAEVRTGPDSIEVGAVHALFGGLPTGRGYIYDISADGSRILAVPPVYRKGPEPITLIENWAAGLKK
jgi:hypothetical protein